MAGATNVPSSVGAAIRSTFIACCTKGGRRCIPSPASWALLASVSQRDFVSVVQEKKIDGPVCEAVLNPHAAASIKTAEETIWESFPFFTSSRLDRRNCG